MSDESILPFLSKFDPAEPSEGSLDPLGLYSIADALGVYLAPGVRERQSTPRFLTLALVGMAACGDINEAQNDGKGVPPWLVFEWLVVEALVRHFRGTNELQGLPGRDKVLATLEAGEYVCARNYLKTPSVFGFHGVYRVLGTKAGIFDGDGHPLAQGYRVLAAWQEEQGMQGFLDGVGRGRDFRKALEKAIRKGLDTGHGADLGSEFRQLVAECLHPRKSGSKENAALWAAITKNDPMRAEYAHKLTTSEGSAAWIRSQSDEAKYHAWLIEQASPSMRQLLAAIRSYEYLARLLIDAFDEMRWFMTQERRPMSLAALGEGRAVLRANREFRGALSDALIQLGEVDINLKHRAERSLIRLGEAASGSIFAAHLLEHHQSVQKAKPPNGKRAWFDQFGDARVAIRPGYVVDEFEPAHQRYVHFYRCQPLTSFGRLLGRVDPAGDAS